MCAVRGEPQDRTPQVPGKGLRGGERNGMCACRSKVPELQGTARGKIIPVPQEEGGAGSSEEVEGQGLDAVPSSGTQVACRNPRSGE